ncbi:MAG: hypothetical protein ACK5LL_07345, partial [Suipraeoptans sp.]
MNRYIKMVCMIVIFVIITGCAKDENYTDQTNAIETVGVEDTSIEEDIELNINDTPLFIAEGIRQLVITEGQEILIDISYEPEEYEESYEYWKIREPYGEFAIVDTEQMLLFFHLLETMQLEPVESSNDLKEELSQSETFIEISYCQEANDESESSYRAEADSKTRYQLIQMEDDLSYVMLNGNSDLIFRINKETINNIMTVNTYDLILKIAVAVPIDTIESLEISFDGNDYTLSDDNEDFSKIYSDLIGLSIVGEADESKITQDVMLSYEI